MSLTDEERAEIEACIEWLNSAKYFPPCDVEEFAARLRRLLPKQETLEEAVDGFVDNFERFDCERRAPFIPWVNRLRAALARAKEGK